MKKFSDIHMPHPHIGAMHMPHIHVADWMLMSRAEELFKSKQFWSVVAIVLIAAFLVVMSIWAAFQGTGTEERIVTPFLYGP